METAAALGTLHPAVAGEEVAAGAVGDAVGRVVTEQLVLGQGDQVLS